MSHAEEISGLVEKYVAACIADALAPVTADRDRLAAALVALEHQLTATGADRDRLATALASSEDELAAALARIRELTAPTAPADSWAGVLRYGVIDSHFDALNSQLDGKLQVRRFYEGSWPSAPTAREVADFARGVRPWVSFSGPSAAEINSGAFDKTLAAYFAASDKPKLVSWLHEVDNGPKADPAEFRAASARIHAIKEAHCPIPREVKFGPVLTGWAFTTGGAQNFMDFMTPGAMDFIGTDPYRFWRPQVQADGLSAAPVDPKSKTYGKKRSMEYLCSGVSQGQQLMPYAKSLGIPVAVGEYGAHPDPTNPTDKATWLQETHDYFIANGVIAAVYFHGPWGESGPWWLDRFHTFTPREGDAARANGARDVQSVATFRSFLPA